LCIRYVSCSYQGIHIIINTITGHLNLPLCPQVLPILNETRPLVTMYNAAYRRAVLAISSPRCRWLAIEDEVCSGGAGRPEYVLDGTHIHPVYASTLIEGALNDKK